MKMLNKFFLLIISFSLGLIRADLPIFPGAEGFGTTTPAGRGGEVIKVTNLNAGGSGSLKAAIDASGPRTVVFEVGGVIEITEYINIRNPFITIAGQTAPSPGITLFGAGIWVKTHDVLLQHIRIRDGGRTNGPDPYTRSCLRIYQSGQLTNNVVADHCSFSWGVDENVTMWGYGTDNCREITISNCFITECLDNSIHPEGGHSKGLIVGGKGKQVSILRNLFAHNGDRNPNIKGGTTTIILNNLVYDPGGVGIDLAEVSMYGGDNSVSSSIVGNVMISGPTTNLSPSPTFIKFNVNSSNSKVYEHDNIADSRWAVSNDWNQASRVNAPEEATWITPMTVRSSDEVRDYVLANSGARPADRDTTDRRIINEVLTKTGRRIDHPNQVEGYPQAVETRHTLNIPANHNGDDDGDGYTNLEEWLHELAQILEEPAVLTTNEKRSKNLLSRNGKTQSDYSLNKLINDIRKSDAGDARIFSVGGTLIIEADKLVSGIYLVQIRDKTSRCKIYSRYIHH